jgi:hypothetical protein
MNAGTLANLYIVVRRRSVDRKNAAAGDDGERGQKEGARV